MCWLFGSGKAAYFRTAGKTLVATSFVQRMFPTPIFPAKSSSICWSWVVSVFPLKERWTSGRTQIAWEM